MLAAVSIVVGNVGALGQSSLKRMLGYSGVAQAGYILGGIVVASEAGVNAMVFYLAGYAFMNLAAFAVIVARERETPYGDEIRAVQGLGRERPALAWPLTISMLGLAGLPATVGFIGKLYLIEALIEGDYTWLAVFIAVGTMISLAYYLRVVAAMWMPVSAWPTSAGCPSRRAAPFPVRWRPEPAQLDLGQQLVVRLPQRRGVHAAHDATPPRRASPYDGPVHGILRSVWDEPRPPGRARGGCGATGRWSRCSCPPRCSKGCCGRDLPWRPLSVAVTVGLLPTLLWRRTRPLLMVAIAFGVTAVAPLLTGGDARACTRWSTCCSCRTRCSGGGPGARS